MSPADATAALAKRSFEEALEELERCVRRLDTGELPLEQALQEFEKGVALVRECQEQLDDAERRIVELSDAGETTTLKAR